jgi:peptide/nickel transport system substrate-binding protein
MRWLRLSFYCVPVFLVAVTHHFLASLGHREEAARESITFAITAEPMGIDPLTEQDPVSEEIEGLLFDTLLGRGPDLRLEGRLAETWSWSSRARFFCTSERYAAEAWAKVEETRPRWEEWGVTEARRIGDEIRVQFSHHDPAGPERVAAVIPGELRVPVDVWRLRTEHSALPSFENFRAQAVEGWQSRRTWAEDEGSVEVCSAGNGANFERELRLYYEHNAELRARVEKGMPLPYLHEPAVTLFLRPGVRWHDGRPFTVEDVLHSIRMARESRNHPALSSAIRCMLEVEPRGPLAFQVSYREPFGPALELWEQIRMLPAHAWHAYAPQAPEIPLVGTGPFVIRRWLPGGPIELDRFPGYFRGEPETPHILYKRVLENRLRRILFEIGTIDSYEAHPSAYAALQETGKFDVVRGPAVQRAQVAWNLDHPPFADVRVRTALAQAIDARAVIADVLGGQGQPADRWFHPGAGFAPPPVAAPLAWQPDAARKALAGADLDNRLRFTLTLVGGDEFLRDVARHLQRQWRRVGVTVQLRIVSHATMSGIRSGHGRFEAVLFLEPLPHHVDQHARWHSSEIGPGRGNITRLRDVRVDRTLEEIRRSDDPSRHAELAARLQEQLQELQPCLPVLLRDSARVFRRGQVMVADPSRGGNPGEGRELRPVGANRMALTGDLAWWVEREEPAAREGAP